MKKTLKEEMLEAIEDTHKFMSANCLTGHLAASCASIAEKHIEITRLETEIKCYKQLVPYVGIFREEGLERILVLEQELEQLKKQ